MKIRKGDVKNLSFLHHLDLLMTPFYTVGAADTGVSIYTPSLTRSE